MTRRVISGKRLAAFPLVRGTVFAEQLFLREVLLVRSLDCVGYITRDSTAVPYVYSSGCS